MSARYLLFGSLLLLLCGCRPSATTSEDFEAIQAEEPAPVEDVNATGAKIAIIVRDARDPWNQRQIMHAVKEAKSDHTRLSIYKAINSRALEDDLTEAHSKGVQGVIICEPDRKDGPLILRDAAQYDLKILNTDDPIVDEKGRVTQPPMLSCDFRSAGAVAAKAMIATCHQKPWKWDLDQTGMMLFTHDSLKSSKDVTDEEKREILKAAVSPSKVFVIPIDTMSIATAEDLATKTLKQNVQIRNWFVGGMSDTVVIGGLQAIEGVHISPGRAIGVGIEGDGAIYDLQRPVMSGMVASVLLPADTLGERAEHEMSDWILNNVKPVDYDLFQGVLLNRPNVRQLKSQHHLFE